MVWIGHCVSLKELCLQKNQIEGALPEDIGNLKDLEVLNLSDNEIAGPIPSSLGNCTKLRILQLQFNHLTGDFPASLGQLCKLEELSICCNQVTGELPWTLGNLVFLRVLDVEKNRMSGPFHPEAFGSMRNLVNFEYSDNNFDIPEALYMYLQDEWFERIYNARISETKKLVTYFRKILDLWAHFSVAIQCAYRCRAACRKVHKLRRMRDMNMAADAASARAAHIAQRAAHAAITAVMGALNEEEAMEMRLEMEKLRQKQTSWKGKAGKMAAEMKVWLREKKDDTAEKARYLRSAEARADLKHKLRTKLEPLTDNKHAEALVSISRKSHIVLVKAGGKAKTGALMLQPLAKGAARGSVRMYKKVKKPIVNWVAEEMGVHNESDFSMHSYSHGGQRKRDSVGSINRPASYYKVNPRYQVVENYTVGKPFPRSNRLGQGETGMDDSKMRR